MSGMEAQVSTDSGSIVRIDSTHSAKSPQNDKLWFEDLREGQRWISDSRTISQGEIREFADLTGDFTPIHIDEDYAATTPFRGTIAHGMLGMSLMAGLSTQAPKIETLALLDISAWRFRAPIYVGDEIHVVTEVVEKSDHGRRHGSVKWYRKLVNQRGETVQDGILTTLVCRRSIAKNVARKEHSQETV
jgi:3-hydroxybutyryl-CoA dehydratase